MTIRTGWTTRDASIPLMNLVAGELPLYSLDLQEVIFSAFSRREPSCSIAGRYFSNHRFPNWTGAFRRIQLSRPGTLVCLDRFPLAVRALRHTVADFSVALFPFPMYRALPRSFEYYENSVAMSLAADRRSRSSLAVPVRT